MLYNERIVNPPPQNVHVSGKQKQPFFLKNGYEVIETETSDLIVKMQKNFWNKFLWT